MRVLAIDTLTRGALSVAAVDGGSLAAGRDEAAPPTAGGRTAERLLPVIGEILDEAGWGWRGVDLVAVAAGPGGFTAIRTGVAAARALALALGRPGLAVSSLETAAEAAGEGEPLLALRDLGRGQVAAQAFDAGLGPAWEARLLTAAEASELAASGGWRRIAGDEAILVSSCASASPRPVEPGPAAHYVAAAALRRLARGGSPLPGTELRPIYLRAPDAEPAAGRPLLAALAAAAAATATAR